jgi:hypothetical protein
MSQKAMMALIRHQNPLTSLLRNICGLKLEEKGNTEAHINTVENVLIT